MADVLSQKRSEDLHQQVAIFWNMIGEIIITNPILQATRFLANLVISNDQIEGVKMTQVDDKELNAFIEKITEFNVEDA